MRNKQKSRKKGQINSIDAFFALAIFSILLILVVINMNNYSQKLNEKIEYDNMMTKAFQISELLVKDRGVPTNWNTNNVQIIGLAAEDRMLSEEKINYMKNLSINEAKSIFKIYDSNFYLSLKNVNGSSITDYGSPFTGKKAVNIKRYVLYKNASAILEFSVWK